MMPIDAPSIPRDNDDNTEQRGLIPDVAIDCRGERARIVHAMGPAIDIDTRNQKHDPSGHRHRS